MPVNISEDIPIGINERITNVVAYEYNHNDGVNFEIATPVDYYILNLNPSSRVFFALIKKVTATEIHANSGFIDVYYK